MVQTKQEIMELMAKDIDSLLRFVEKSRMYTCSSNSLTHDSNVKNLSECNDFKLVVADQRSGNHDIDVNRHMIIQGLKKALEDTDLFYDRHIITKADLQDLSIWSERQMDWAWQHILYGEERFTPVLPM